MSQFFSTRSQHLWSRAVALSFTAVTCVAASGAASAAPTAAATTPAVSTTAVAARTALPSTTVRSSAAISSTGNAGAMWTTYKGNAQRTGAINMPVRLPLNLQWRYTSDADPGAIIGSPLVVGTGAQRRVLFNAGKYLYCLDSESGETLWKWTADSALRAPLSLLPGAGDAVLTLSSKGSAQAIRISDGTPVWKYQADSSLRVAPLMIHTTRGDRIILAPSSGALVALTPQGALDSAWRVVLGAGGASPSAAPVADAKGDRIFVPTSDGAVYGIDTRAARVAFTTILDAAPTSSPVVIGNMMVAVGTNTMVAVRTDNGSTLWRATAGAENFTTVSGQPGPTIASSVIYAGTNRGTLLAFNARDGKPLWKASLGRASLSGSPLVLRGAVLVGSRDGVLYGVNSANGQLLWRYRLESERQVLVPVRATTSANGVSSQPTAPINNGGRFGGGFNGGFNGGGFNGGGIPSGGIPSGVGGVATATPMAYETRVYGTSSAPAAVDGQIYIPADNAALYAFSTTGFDASPPLVSDITIVIPDTTNAPYPVQITPDFPGIANKGPVSFTLQLADAGSGIDASRIKVTFDGQVLPAADVKFDAASGILSLALFKPKSGAMTLSDGTHTVAVQVTDYNGNASQTSTSFLVNSTFVSPTKQVAGSNTINPSSQQPQPGNGWRGGRNGAGGRNGGGRGNWDPSQGPPPWARRRNGGDGN